MVALGSPTSLWLCCLVVLPGVERGEVQSPNMVADLSTSPFSSTSCILQLWPVMTVEDWRIFVLGLPLSLLYTLSPSQVICFAVKSSASDTKKAACCPF